MRTRLALATGLAAVSLLALAACAAPGAGGDGSDGAGSDGSGSDGSSGVTGGLAGCIDGTWEADTADMATQLQDSMNSSGGTITSSTADGGITLDVVGDQMTYDADVTFTIVADSDGLELQVVQSHVGTSTGRWQVEGDQVVFTDWETGITITNTISIAGEAAGDSTEMPADDGSGVPMTVQCDGDTMVTQPEVSPFSTTWMRVG
jgi:uncharacterized lipoprotein NlpE involved in copper resistance